MKAGHLGWSTLLRMKLRELATILRHGLRHKRSLKPALESIRPSGSLGGKTRLESFLGEEIVGLLQAGRGKCQW